MKNLKEELRKIAENWNVSGEYDGTEFADRFFIGDTELDEFAIEHGLTVWQDCDEGQKQIADWRRTLVVIQGVCSCKFIYDYAGANPNRQFGDYEIIFNS